MSSPVSSIETTVLSCVPVLVPWALLSLSFPFSFSLNCSASLSFRSLLVDLTVCFKFLGLERGVEVTGGCWARGRELLLSLLLELSLSELLELLLLLLSPPFSLLLLLELLSVELACPISVFCVVVVVVVVEAVVYSSGSLYWVCLLYTSPSPRD